MADRAEQHSLQLAEDEELQLALAISAAEAPDGATGASEDERLARQLQVRLDPAHQERVAAGTAAATVRASTSPGLAFG